MSEKRIQFSNIVQNQLPVYTNDEFPLVSEFLKSYYQGQEYEGGPIDLAQNIDEYVKSISVQAIKRDLDYKYVVSVFTFVKEKLSRLNDKSILRKGMGWPIMNMPWKTFLARRQIGNSNS